MDRQKEIYINGQSKGKSINIIIEICLFITSVKFETSRKKPINNCVPVTSDVENSNIATALEYFGLETIDQLFSKNESETEVKQLSENTANNIQ